MMSTHLSDQTIQEYLEGDLLLIDKSRITDHLLSCPGCRKEVSRYRRIMQLLEADAGFQLSPQFSERIIQNLPETGTREKPLWDFLWIFLIIIIGSVTSWLSGGKELISRIIQNFDPAILMNNSVYLDRIKNSVHHLPLEYLISGLAVFFLIHLMDSFLFHRKTTFLV